jgi:hypothetical protein
MALADYYARGALAAAQVLNGFDEARFRAKLEETTVGVAFDVSVAMPEGQALAELLVRLLARIYPRLALLGPTNAASDLAALAKAINPAIEIINEADVGTGIGRVETPFETTFYAGAAGWDALLSATRRQPIGDSQNPFGAAVAACLAAANVFRRVFLADWHDHVDDGLRFSAWSFDRTDRATGTPGRPWELRGDAVLVGVGAVGNAALWTLARAPLAGSLHLIDPQDIELSNLQRYVLATRADEGRSKVDVAASFRTLGLDLVPHQLSLQEFVSQRGYRWEYFLLGLDSANDRRSAQAALPRWIANAWTQPGDLGISTHPKFGGEGACVACLYLPDARLPNEDELVAAALNVPQLQMDVRTLLFNSAPLGRPFLEAVARAVGRPLEALLPFEGRSIRDLYVEGFCGGAVIPLGEAGRPPQDLHVPLAHQSALAGVLLAAALVRAVLRGDPSITSASRLNVLQGLGSDLAQPIRANRDGRCLCDDVDFRAQYVAKYPRAESLPGPPSATARSKAEADRS